MARTVILPIAAVLGLLLAAAPMSMTSSTPTGKGMRHLEVP